MPFVESTCHHLSLLPLFPSYVVPAAGGALELVRSCCYERCGDKLWSSGSTACGNYGSVGLELRPAGMGARAAPLIAVVVAGGGRELGRVAAGCWHDPDVGRSDDIARRSRRWCGARAMPLAAVGGDESSGSTDHGSQWRGGAREAWLPLTLRFYASSCLHSKLRLGCTDERCCFICRPKLCWEDNGEKEEEGRDDRRGAKGNMVLLLLSSAEIDLFSSCGVL